MTLPSAPSDVRNTSATVGQWADGSCAENGTVDSHRLGHLVESLEMHFDHWLANLESVAHPGRTARAAQRPSRLNTQPLPPQTR
jgi:hypothetical protein